MAGKRYETENPFVLFLFLTSNIIYKRHAEGDLATHRLHFTCSSLSAASLISSFASEGSIRCLHRNAAARRRRGRGPKRS